MKAKQIARVLGVVAVLATLWVGTTSAATLPPMHVGRVQASYTAGGSGGYQIWVTVTIHDMEHMPLPGAAVTVQWVEPNGIHATQQAATNWQGQAKFEILSAVQGTYQACVTNVARAGWVYDPRSNEQTCASLAVPRVVCPNDACPAPAPVARLICVDGNCPTLHSGPAPVARLICINGVCPAPAPVARLICIDGNCPTLHSGPAPVARLICINGVCPAPAPVARLICVDGRCPTLHSGPAPDARVA